MGHEGDGGGQAFDNPLQVHAFALLYGQGYPVGTAQTDEGIAHIKEAGGNHTHSPQEALGKGHGEGADIVAGGIENGEGLFLLASAPGTAVLIPISMNLTVLGIS